ncbi:MAG TPA: type I secretion system permease/ATPase [Alphaproteobacteria bacterium]
MTDQDASSPDQPHVPQDAPQTVPKGAPSGVSPGIPGAQAAPLPAGQAQSLPETVNSAIRQALEGTGGMRPEAVSKEWMIRSGLVDYEDPLLSCLALMTSLLQKPISRQALKAGLPNADTRFTPDLCIRAADRAGFSARIVQRSDINKISGLVLPCIVLLRDGNAAVLLKIDRKTKMAELAAAETGGKIYVSLKELAQDYIGHAIFVRPKFAFDPRSDYHSKYDVKDWFWGTLNRFRPIYVHTILASLLINIFALVSPLFTMNVYDRVVPNNAIETLAVLALGVFLVYTFDLVLKYLRSYFIDVAGKNADIIIASKLLERVMAMRLDKKPESVGMMANNLKEYETVRDFFTSGTLVMLIDLPFALLFIGVIALISGPLALIPLIAVPIIITLGWVLQKPLKRITDLTHAESNQKHAMLVETLSGLETIKTSGAQSRVQGRWENVVSRTADTSTKAKKIGTLATGLTQYIMNLTTVTIVVVGVFMISSKMITMGALIATTMLAGRALAPMGSVAGLLLKYEQSRVSLESLNKLMNTPSERPMDKVFHHVPELQGQIEFQNVSFSYPNQQGKALDDVSFSIRPGERVAILGKIGSGKSTIGRMLMGLYEPSEGTILLDGIDIRQIDPADVRRHIGYVGQDNYLFYGTVRENIAYGTPHVDENAIQIAAHFSGVMDFVRQKAHGMDLPVGERGMALSGGQRQSVAIARALVGNPPILMMDEPTSNMDSVSENRFQERIGGYRGLKTLICVTHRSSMLAIADRIIVMDNGRIVADGPKEQVLQALQQGDVKKG